jgi:hypothetical protein
VSSPLLRVPTARAFRETPLRDRCAWWHTELGGAEAVIKDPSKREQAQRFLDSSDQILLAATVDVKDEVIASRQAIEAALTKQLSEQGASMAKQHEVMSQQVEKLTTMLQAVVAMQANGLPATEEGKEPPTEEGEVILLAQPALEPEPVKQMECDAERVRQLMDQTPISSKEGKRRAVVDEVFGEREVGCTWRAGLEELIGDEELRAIVNEAAKEFDVPTAWIGGA